jgi:hypothetical protein
MLGIILFYVLFEKYGQPLWVSHWHLYLTLEAMTHVFLAFFVLIVLEGFSPSIFLRVFTTLLPDIDHVVWAPYRSFFHTPIFVLSPLLFQRYAKEDARLLTFMFATHYLFDTRSQMAWWLNYGVWLLPPKGLPVLVPWLPLVLLVSVGLLAGIVGHYDQIEEYLEGKRVWVS